MQVGNDGAYDSIGGNSYAIGTIEATFPVGLPESFGISGEVFSDFGTVFNSGQSSVASAVGTNCNGGFACTVADKAGLRASIGAGLVWASPFGPLKFEVAYPIVKAATDDTQIWRFSIGTSF